MTIKDNECEHETSITFETDKDAYLFARLLSSIVDCVSGENETQDIVETIIEAKYKDVDEKFSNQWDMTILTYYELCSPKIRQLMCRVIKHRTME